MYVMALLESKPMVLDNGKSTCSMEHTKGTRNLHNADKGRGWAIMCMKQLGVG